MRAAFFCCDILHGQGDTQAQPVAALMANFITPLCGHDKKAFPYGILNLPAL